MGWGQTGPPSLWAGISPQGCSPPLPHLQALGSLGAHQGLLEIHVMFPDPSPDSDVGAESG